MKRSPLNAFASARKAEGGWLIELRLDADPAQEWWLKEGDRQLRMVPEEGLLVARWTVDGESFAAIRTLDFALAGPDRGLRIRLEPQEPEAGQELLHLRLNWPLPPGPRPAWYAWYAWYAAILLPFMGASWIAMAFRHPQPPGMEWFYGILGSLFSGVGLFLALAYLRNSSAERQP